MEGLGISSDLGIGISWPLASEERRHVVEAQHVSGVKLLDARTKFGHLSIVLLAKSNQVRCTGSFRFRVDQHVQLSSFVEQL